MSLECWRAETLLERRGSGLAEPDRLRLEQHLQSCEECSVRADALSRIVELVGPGFELSSSQRARVIGRALRAPRAPTRAQQERALWQWFFAPIALSALAIVVLVLTSRPPPPALARFSAPSGVDGSRFPDRLSHGEVTANGVKLVPGQAFAPGAELATTSGATLRLAHAEVELAAATRAHWDAEHRVLTLNAGRVHVEVDPRPKKSFGVETSRFAVEVRGTVFDVSLDEVSVREGHVRVSSGELTADLFAGQRWSVEALTAPAKPSVDISGLLAHARARLAARDVAAARRDVNLALGSRPSPAQDAEARSLLAECALVAGDAAEAQRRYAEVAKEHAGTAAAETADFASARLERDPSRARALLTAYLAKYPNGRFRAEAQQRLRALER